MTPIREEYEERAAIYEFDAGHPRHRAEAMALRDIVERHGFEAAQRLRFEINNERTAANGEA